MTDGPGLRSGIDRDRWPRIRALFEQAVELPPDEVSRLLDRACREDGRLRADVEMLLRADRATGTALDRPIAELAADLLTQPEEPGPELPLDGARIGAWRVVREIARGGMGTVYLAERADGQFEQRVALKVVKRGLDTDEILSRFRLERQILARLQHSGIAHLVDGGVTDDGRPWFAMDFVEGEPLTDHCRARIRRLPDLLRLFEQACRAVEYAHRNLVVHRDLKPGNILVTPDGVVKLLDFGIAKLLEPQAQGTETLASGPRMTPHYAAPEQVRGEPPSTATDVYALGVILYELLTGERPYRLTTRTLAELESAILEQEPAPPSAKVSRVQNGAQTAEAAGSIEWRRQLRGDLDNIVLKALRKEPELRYPTATALREDLERFLAGLPVLATPPSLRDRGIKFVRRHRAGVVAGALVLTSLLAGLVGVAWQAQRARDEARKSNEIRDFLVGVFEASDPNVAKGDTLTAIELLERGTDRIDRDLAGQPALQAEMLRTLAGIYRQLQVYDRAESLARRALTIDSRELGDGSLAAARDLLLLGNVLADLGRFDEAERALMEALERRGRKLGARHADYAEALRPLAALRGELGRMAEAESLLRQALAIEEAAFGPKHPRVAQDLTDLGELLFDLARYADAEPYQRRALEILSAAHGHDHLSTATAIENLSGTIAPLGRGSQAESLTRVALAIRRRLMGPHDNIDVANSLSNLGGLLWGSARYAGAESAFVEALRMYRSRLGDEHPEVSRNLNNLAVVMRAQGRLAEAESLFRVAIQLWTRTLGPDHPNTLRGHDNLASVLRMRGRFVESERLCRQVLDRKLRVFGPNDFRTGLSYSGLGLVLYQMARFPEAERLQRKAIAIYWTAPRNAPPELSLTRVWLGRLLLDARRPEGARDTLEAVLASTVAMMGPRTPQTAWVAVPLGRALSLTGRSARAESLLREAVAIRERFAEVPPWERAEARVALGLALVRAGRVSEGRDLVARNLAAMQDNGPFYLVNEAQRLVASTRR